MLIKYNNQTAMYPMGILNRSELYLFNIKN